VVQQYVDQQAGDGGGLRSFCRSCQLVHRRAAVGAARARVSARQQQLRDRLGVQPLARRPQLRAHPVCVRRRKLEPAPGKLLLAITVALASSRSGNVGHHTAGLAHPLLLLVAGERRPGPADSVLPRGCGSCGASSGPIVGRPCGCRSDASSIAWWCSRAAAHADAITCKIHVSNQYTEQVQRGKHSVWLEGQDQYGPL